VVTSLPRRVLRLVVDAVGLKRHIDLALSLEDAPRGFPAPDLALTAMLQLGVAGVQDLAMVHGTGAGMECGRNSGAGAVVGVLTGAHSAARLRAAGATHVVRSVADLPGVLDSLYSRASRATGTDNGTPSNGAVGTGSDAVSVAIDVPPQSPPERHRLGH
jgi:phosphoglycolate phosphatase-like HAD superfamily hydrolase